MGGGKAGTNGGPDPGVEVAALNVATSIHIGSMTGGGGGKGGSLIRSKADGLAYGGKADGDDEAMPVTGDGCGGGVHGCGPRICDVRPLHGSLVIQGSEAETDDSSEVRTVVPGSATNQTPAGFDDVFVFTPSFEGMSARGPEETYRLPG